MICFEQIPTKNAKARFLVKRDKRKIGDVCIFFNCDIVFSASPFASLQADQMRTIASFMKRKAKNEDKLRTHCNS